MKILISVFLLIVMVIAFKYWVDSAFDKINLQVTSAIEQAYFEGQKDYMNGDIRIEYTESGWVWTKSPWNSEDTPVFNPKNEDRK